MKYEPVYVNLPFQGRNIEVEVLVAGGVNVKNINLRFNEGEFFVELDIQKDFSTVTEAAAYVTRLLKKLETLDE